MAKKKKILRGLRVNSKRGMKNLSRKVSKIYREQRFKVRLKARDTLKLSEEHVFPTGTKKGDLFEKAHKFNTAKEIIAAGVYPYFRAIESGQDTEVVYHGKTLIMIGSNNYLGLTSDPRVKEASIEAIRKYGTGCSGSRFLNGTPDLHVKLEKAIAEFVGKEESLLYSTGFTTNVGVVSTLPQKDDIIYCDRINHASIIDGTRLSIAKTVKYKHNDMEDLERLISKDNPRKGKLIVTDGVFSMEGELCKLPDIVRIAQKYGAKVMVDDAHSVGIFGKTGAGVAEHFGLVDKVDLLMGTFSKSFASMGGYIAGDSDVISYLKHTSRAQIFQASMPPANVAAALKALEIMRSEPERKEHLWKIVAFMLKSIRELGFKTGHTESAIIPIFIGDDFRCFKMGKRLEDEGVFVNPVVSPAVAQGQALIRTSFTATHTMKEMEFVLDKFKKVGKELGVI